MEILVAKSGGFCRGVKKAVDTALTIDPENTYIYGEIIHNKEVVDTITKRGIITVDSLSEVPDGATLIIRSHGAAKKVFDECADRGIKVVDCTCEFVRRTQRIADEQHRAGNTVIIIGERTHPEVIGINGWCEEQAYIFASEDDDFSVLPEKKCCVVAQTTFSKEKFEKIIGYEFRNKRLLERALTHSSYCNEIKRLKNQSNERLEFLGDAVLEVTVSDYLFEKYPDKTEGELTKLRASIVCEPTLALCSRQIKLGEWILLSKGEEHTGGRNRDSITSDAMEAVIGAIYRDGGFEPAQDYIRRFILEDIDNKKLFYDSKTILQELLQKDSGFEPEYEITGESGPDHDKHFTAVVKCDGTVIGDGEGHTKKAAQQAAAYNAILKMRQNRK